MFTLRSHRRRCRRPFAAERSQAALALQSLDVVVVRKREPFLPQALFRGVVVERVQEEYSALRRGLGLSNLIVIVRIRGAILLDAPRSVLVGLVTRDFVRVGLG